TVRYPEDAGVERISAGQGQQGSGWCGRAVVGGVRAGREGQPVQALESTVVGKLLSAACTGGGDSQARWRREDSRGSDRRRSDRPDGGGYGVEPRGGAGLSPGLVWLSSGAFGVGG